MNFNSLVNKLDILEEARAGRFDKLFNTGYLKKAIEDKKIGVARPLVFEFIINFLKEKGLVPEDTAFAGSRYAAEAGEFIRNLVDSGMVKDEIADEFKQYMNEKLGEFVKMKQQVRSRGKGENIGKSFGSKEEFEQFGKVKSPEEMAAEKQAKKDAEKAAAEDIPPTAPIDAKTSIIEIVVDPEVQLDVAKLQKFFATANKNQPFDTDETSSSAVDFEFGEDTPITKVITKVGANKVEASIKASLSKMLGLSGDELEVIVHAPGYFEFGGEEKPKTKSMRSGVDTQGYGMGTIAPDDSARRLSNPFEDEETPEPSLTIAPAIKHLFLVYKKYFIDFVGEIDKTEIQNALLKADEYLKQKPGMRRFKFHIKKYETIYTAQYLIDSLKKKLRDEKTPVTENTKTKVKFIANKDMKAKTYWQKMAQQEMFYR